MKQERCVLPVKCKHWGGVFDLWWDLQVQERLREASGMGSVAVSRRVGRLLDQQSSCWDCRRKLTGGEFEEDEAVELVGYNFLGFS